MNHKILKIFKGLDYDAPLKTGASYPTHLIGHQPALKDKDPAAVAICVLKEETHDSTKLLYMLLFNIMILFIINLFLINILLFYIYYYLLILIII